MTRIQQDLPAHVPSRVVDHMVSGEAFKLVYDARLHLLETHPRPGADELGKYYESDAYLSHTDGKEGLFERLYQGVKRYALGRKLRLVERLAPRRGSILDYGAGTGEFLVRAQSAGWQIYGIEPNQVARQRAKEKGIGMHLERGGLGEMKFDAITLWHVLEHLPDLEASCQYLVDHLKPGGVLIIAVPNYMSWDARFYGAEWAAYDVPRHLWHFSKSSLKLLFEDQLVMEKIKPMIFDSFYVSLLSESYRKNKWRWPAAIVSGLRSNLHGMRSGEYSSHVYCFRKPN